MRPRWQRTRDGGVVLAIGLVFAPACGRSPTHLAPGHPPGEVWLSKEQLANAKLVVQRVVSTTTGAPLLISGHIAFDDVRVAHVVSPVSGRITAISAALGQHVLAGQRLATLDSPDVGQAQADFGRARADLQAATRNFERQNALFAQHAAARRDFEQAQDTLEKARAEHTRLKQKLVLWHVEPHGLEAAAEPFRLEAPIAGEVIARNINPGAEIQGQYGGAGASAALFTVGELDPIFALGEAFEMDLPHVHLNDAVDITVVAYPGRTFRGQVVYVGAGIDPHTGTTQIRCRMQNPNRLLKPGMFAALRVLGIERNQISIPARSVFRAEGRTFVVMKAGEDADGNSHFVRHNIVIDERVAGSVIPVHSGLEAGDMIVSSGGILLTEILQD